jgi:hypothetical protein
MGIMGRSMEARERQPVVQKRWRVREGAYKEVLEDGLARQLW